MMPMREMPMMMLMMIMVMMTTRAVPAVDRNGQGMVLMMRMRMMRMHMFGLCIFNGKMTMARKLTELSVSKVRVGEFPALISVANVRSNH